MVEILTKADKLYHNDGITKFTDEEYDLLIDTLRKKAPKNAYFKKIGFKPPDR